MSHDYDDEDESEFLHREPCPKCGSEDNLARYSDGHAYCFGVSCGHYEPATSGRTTTTTRPTSSTARGNNASLLSGSYMYLQKRKLTEETCKKFDYRVVTFNGQPAQAATYRDSAGNPIAQKLRFADKGEGMPWVGDKKQASLFGSHLWGKGRKLVITEGELDAMAVSQVQAHKWPVVSIGHGCDGAKKHIAKNLDYIKNFEEIILMFDMDDAGRAAVEEVASVLTGMKVFVASLPLKDACECLMADKADAIVSAIWNAKPYSPASVVFGEDIVARRRNRPKVTSYPFPSWLEELNRKVMGIRLGELDTWTSGSGMGKTTMLRQLQIHYLRTTQFNQAVIMLEEPLEDTADEMVSVALAKRLKLPEVAASVTPEEEEAAERELFLSKDAEGNSRFYFHDAFGSCGSDEDLMNRIRYFVHAHNCKIVWLDHLSILVSNMGEDGDERRRIDSLMHNLKSLTVELGIYIGLVCHLKKAAGAGRSFEEGAVPSLDDLRGSGGIKQLSNGVLALSRNQQAETEGERNTARVHVLKCRYTGDTGNADFIFFNKLTGVFEVGADPEIAGGFAPVDDLGSDGPVNF